MLIQKLIILYSSVGRRVNYEIRILSDENPLTLKNFERIWEFYVGVQEFFLSKFLYTL
ncbi:MAG: hypothetical protein BAJALOKI3v1_1090005 [Promethearchaeota archaeon]|nr:MAG: hypothetical protein BAJALOKI3v1_1090005 [Candidatus Lokiarchaeota archaeon]